ncbi:MAG: hypothetical protein AB1384_00595 [Actinomycetota bacterium]
MNRIRLFYAAGGGFLGLVLVGVGWGVSSYYLVVAGTVVIAASLAWMTIPMPTVF